MIVFIHGFMGSPNFFCGLATRARDMGHKSASVVLSGHCGKGAAYARARRQDWARDVRRVTESADEPVLLVGHSIGGLLAVRAAAENPNVKGLFLISTPLKLNVFSPPALWRRFWDLFNPLIRKANTELCGVPLSSPYVWLGFASALQVPLLIRESKPLAERLNIPVVTVHSRRDEVVSFKSAEMFAKRLANAKHEGIELSVSRHTWFEAGEWGIVEARFAEFVSVPW